MHSTFIHFGLNPLSLSDVHQKIGQPIHVFFEGLSISEQLKVQIIDYFRSILSDHQFSRNDLFPGVIDLLNLLKKRGWMIGVATSKPTLLAISTLEKTEIFELIDYIVGTDNNLHKPNPWVLGELTRQSSVTPEYFIGDRLEDALAAEALGIKFLGVLQSTHSANYFVSNGFNSVFQDISTLHVHLKSSLK